MLLYRIDCRCFYHCYDHYYYFATIIIIIILIDTTHIHRLRVHMHSASMDHGSLAMIVIRESTVFAPSAPQTIPPLLPDKG